MTSNKRTAILVLSLLILLVIGMSAFHGVDVQVDGEDISGVNGFFGFLLACGIGALAVVFALGLTGLVLTGVAILLCIVFAIVLGSLALALLPLLFPVLLLVGLIALFTRRKSA